MRRAAESGHGGAMTAMGRFHLASKYKLKPLGAVPWFEQGIEAGHGGSMEEMAQLYAEGKIVKRNTAEAIRLAKLGARIGHSGSERLLSKLTNQSQSKTLTLTEKKT